MNASARTFLASLPDLAGAACAEPWAASGEAWFPVGQDDTVTAVETCAACPVAQACFDAAVSRNERWGVWAGVNFGANPYPQGKRRWEWLADRRPQ